MKPTNQWYEPQSRTLETLKGIGAELRGINLKSRQKGEISSTSHFRFAKGSQKWSLTNKFIGICFLLLNISSLFAQNHMYGMNDTMVMDSMMMSHSLSRNLPMNRNGSGTSWQPDSTPIYAYMQIMGKWNLMFHGSVWLRYNNQDITNKGTRGEQMIDAANWFMLMAQRPIKERGLFSFHAMFSLDPLTVGGAGYPLLFQTGESWEGEKLVDHQHPHDLFSELSISYSHALNKDIDLYAYVGYPGEPSIGPTAFMHRISAFNNPDAPLGHHWQDATHITFGVVTAGFRYKIFKLEGSSFTGREPNENRYNFDESKFDSYSYRLSCNLTGTISMQASQAFINSPEALEPSEDITRTTASISHNMKLGHASYLSSSLVWGLNTTNGNDEHSFLAESNYQIHKIALYGRYEFIQKSATELNLLQFDEELEFNIQALTLGVNRIILEQLNTNCVVGIQGSVFGSEKILHPIYGKNPYSAEVYIRINPALMKM